MTTPQITAIFVASATWVSFASTLRTYFRGANKRTLAKTVLTVSAIACSDIQVAVIALTKPAGAAWFWLGMSCFALANLMFWWALCSHGKSHPAFAFIRVAPTSLTTAGPYRVIRHPIYSAYLLAWCAGAAIAGQPLLLVCVAYMGLLYTIAARREERWFLASPLASRYRQYQQRTGMFFPKVRSA
jgi:protein-S-isoprenylcysteine O-methyltransferase Ste14